MARSPEPAVYVPQPLCPPASGCDYCEHLRGHLAAKKEDADARQ